MTICTIKYSTLNETHCDYRMRCSRQLTVLKTGVKGTTIPTCAASRALPELLYSTIPHTCMVQLISDLAHLQKSGMPCQCSHATICLFFRIKGTAVMRRRYSFRTPFLWLIRRSIILLGCPKLLQSAPSRYLSFHSLTTPSHSH